MTPSVLLLQMVFSMCSFLLGYVTAMKLMTAEQYRLLVESTFWQRAWQDVDLEFQRRLLE